MIPRRNQNASLMTPTFFPIHLTPLPPAPLKLTSITHPGFLTLPYLHSPRRSSTMASEATPRVNAKYLDSFTNQTVRILGRVVSLRGEIATIDASGSITVHLNRVSEVAPKYSFRKGGIEVRKEAGHYIQKKRDEVEDWHEGGARKEYIWLICKRWDGSRLTGDPQDAHLQLNNAAEIVGKVQQDLSIKVFQATDFGSNIGKGPSTPFALCCTNNSRVSLFSEVDDWMDGLIGWLCVQL